MTLKEQVTQDMKDAMRAHDSAKLSVLRMLLAAVKQREVDDHAEPTDELVQSVITKLIKQRRDSVEQYLKAERKDLADKEQAEIDALTVYMPKQLTEEEIQAVIAQVMTETGASGMAAMGQVMGKVKALVAGKADMGVVSRLVKAALS